MWGHLPHVRLHGFRGGPEVLGSRGPNPPLPPGGPHVAVALWSLLWATVGSTWGTFSSAGYFMVCLLHRGTAVPRHDGLLESGQANAVLRCVGVLNLGA